MVMACGVNYPYIHSNNFEMNRFFSYLSDLKLTSHHTYVMHYLILFVTGGILCYPTLQEMLLLKG